jgi:hypothetical protein
MARTKNLIPINTLAAVVAPVFSQRPALRAFDSEKAFGRGEIGLKPPDRRLVQRPDVRPQYDWVHQ